MRTNSIEQSDTPEVAHRDLFRVVRLRILQGMVLVAAAASIGFRLLGYDIERFLGENVPGYHMPDAFYGLNQIAPLFMLLVATTALIAIGIEKSSKHVLLIPLLFGPSICFAGWLGTENLADPHWFLLVATATIGMLVSCIVTIVLLIVLRRRTECN